MPHHHRNNGPRHSVVVETLRVSSGVMAGGGGAAVVGFDAGLCTHWPSMWKAFMLAVIAATQFTIHFSSLWPFMKVDDRECL